MPEITRIKAKLKSPVGKRVAAYARVSGSRDEQLNSLSAQVSYYTDYIQKQAGWIFCGIYVDKAITGTIENRPEFQRLLTDCHARKIDLILTKSISRFARNTVTLLETVRELKELGIDVYFERENIHSMSGDGELMLSILASYAQEESYSVSENCKWRIRNDMKEGRTNNGNLLGYKLEKGKLEIVPEETTLVRSIFEDYLSGMGTNAIMRKLRKQSVHICRTTIHNILINEKYIGDMLLQRTYVKDHLTKEQVPNRGELPQYYITDSHEPTISRDSFHQVQEEILHRAAKAPIITCKEYPLTGLITCGKCGAKYRRKHNAAGTKYEKIVWTCATYNTFGKHECDAQQIPETVLIQKVAEVLRLPDLNGVKQYIIEIRVPARNRLVFHFKDGSMKEVEWQNPSRSESWTPEMREAARQKSLERRKNNGNLQNPSHS